MSKKKLPIALVAMISTLGAVGCNERNEISEQAAEAPVEINDTQPNVNNTEINNNEQPKLDLGSGDNQLVEADTTESSADIRDVDSEPKALTIKSRVDGLVSYEGSAIFSGDLRVRQGYCEYCFHIDDSSAELIPEPSADIDEYVVAIPVSETGILDLKADKDKCYSMPVVLELTNYSVDLEGLESFHGADVTRVIEKGAIKESVCDFELI